MSKGILGLLAVVVVVGGAVYMFNSNEPEVVMTAEEAMVVTDMEPVEEMETANAAESADPALVDMSGEVTMMASGSYQPYSSEKLALAEFGDVVLFFHAAWCPSCRGLNADIESNLGGIPEGVTILKVDYDSATELKRQYGVTTQHTLVQVDAAGEMIKKWSGGGDLASVLAQLN